MLLSTECCENQLSGLYCVILLTCADENITLAEVTVCVVEIAITMDQVCEAGWYAKNHVRVTVKNRCWSL